MVVHFHDIFDNWEYPHEWIGEQNRSWNEIYAIRAFMMFNQEFDIIYFNDFMWRHHRQKIEQSPLGPVLRTVKELAADCISENDSRPFRTRDRKSKTASSQHEQVRVLLKKVKTLDGEV